MKLGLGGGIIGVETKVPRKVKRVKSSKHSDIKIKRTLGWLLGIPPSVRMTMEPPDGNGEFDEDGKYYLTSRNKKKSKSKEMKTRKSNKRHSNLISGLSSHERDTIELERCLPDYMPYQMEPLPSLWHSSYSTRTDGRSNCAVLYGCKAKTKMPTLRNYLYRGCSQYTP